jgi:hypothetical protein
MSEGFKVLTDCWPLVVSIAPARLTDADLRPFFDTHERLLARREKYVAMSDLTPVTEIPDAALRRKITEWSQQIEPSVLRYNLGTSIVVSNKLVRGALTAIHWIVPPKQATAIVAQPDEGVSFLLEILEKNGLPVTPAMLRYRDSLASSRRSPVRHSRATLGCCEEKIGQRGGAAGNGRGAAPAPRRGLCPLHPQQGYAPCTAAENPGSAPLGSLHSPDPLCDHARRSAGPHAPWGAPRSRGCLTACAPVAAHPCSMDDASGARGSAGSQRCTRVHNGRQHEPHGSAGALAHLCIVGGHGAGRS